MPSPQEEMLLAARERMGSMKGKAPKRKKAQLSTFARPPAPKYPGTSQKRQQAY